VGKKHKKKKEKQKKKRFTHKVRKKGTRQDTRKLYKRDNKAVVRTGRGQRREREEEKSGTHRQ
jgi:hypothetical protein